MWGQSGAGPHRRTSGGRWWVAFLVVSVVLVGVSATGPARSIQEAGARLLGPVHEAMAGIGQGVAELAATLEQIGRLRADNAVLRSALAGAEQQIAALEEAARENQRLRELLGLRASLGWDLVPARVIRVGTSALTWEVGVEAGRTAGIRVGMPVVGAAPGGGALAGIVVETSTDRSIVRLVVDPRSRAVGRDQQTGALGVVQGQPGGQLVMVQVPLSDPVAVGDTIVTAGLELDGIATSPYPAGLLVGTVQATEDDDNGLTRTVFVSPALDPRGLEWLLVVRSVPAD